VAERQLPKLHVVGSIPIARSRRLKRGWALPASGSILDPHQEKTHGGRNEGGGAACAAHPSQDRTRAGRIIDRAVIDKVQNQDALGGNGAGK
jgi:hypothetical protein